MTETNQKALDRMADVLVEDILSTPADHLLVEVAEDYGNSRALAATFDKIAIRARFNNDRFVTNASPIPSSGDLGALPPEKRYRLVDRLRGLRRNVIRLVFNVIFLNRLAMITVSSACVASLTFIIAAPIVFDWIRTRNSFVPTGAQVFDGSTTGPQSRAPVQEREVANEPGVTRGLQPDSPRAFSVSDSYVAQVSLERREADAQASVRNLQVKFPKVLGDHKATVRRADLGPNGVYYRALVGPFVSASDADRFCSSLRAAGGQCTVQKE